MQPDEPISEVRKIDAARRQLDEAVRLWMEGRDALAIHTLTMAAFGVLYDVSRHRNLVKDGDWLTSSLSQLGHEEFRKLANFLKHADRDPLASCTEPPMQEHEYRIGLALVLYRRLVNDLTPEMGAFHLTSLMTYPELFQVAPDPDPDIEEGAQYGAELLRENWERRRLMAKALLKSIKSGHLPANVNVNRLRS